MKDLLNLSVLQCIESSRSQSDHNVMQGVTIVAKDGLHQGRHYALCQFSTRVHPLPITDTHFLTSLSSRFPSPVVMQFPQHTTAKSTAPAAVTALIKEVQHSLQTLNDFSHRRKKESALSFCVRCICMHRPVQFIIHMDPQILVALNHLSGVTLNYHRQMMCLIVPSAAQSPPSPP